MKKKLLYTVLGTMMVLSLLLAACAPSVDPIDVTIEPAVPTEEPVVEEPVEPVEPEEPVEEGPCLIIGALHGGPINDAGYNQAMHESVAAIAENIECVEIIEAENVPEEAGATATMENGLPDPFR